MVNPSLCNGVHVVCSICFFAQNTLRAHLLWTAFYLSKTQLRVRELNTFTNKHITQSFLDLRNNSSRNSLCCNSGWVSGRTACFARRQLVQFHPNNEQKAAQLWCVLVKKGAKKSRIPCDTCKLKSCLFYQSSMRWRERERQRDCVSEMSPPEYNGHTRIIWCVRKCLPMTRAHRTDKRVSFWWEIERIIELFAFNGNFHRNRLSKWIPY